MTGDEIITITISDGKEEVSTRYSVMQADLFKGTKGEYHLLNLDMLVERFESRLNDRE